MHYRVVIEQDEDGVYVVECPAFARVRQPRSDAGGGRHKHSRRHPWIPQQPEEARGINPATDIRRNR